MTDEGKKISFGFSKSIKKTALKVQPPKEEKKVDYIECLDEKSIKVVGGEAKEEGPLVIPLLGSKTWYDRIVNKTDADIFETKIKKENGVVVKTENGSATENDVQITPMDVTHIKKEKPDEDENVPKTLDEQAASEIIKDLQSDDTKVDHSNLTLPIKENGTLRGEQEATLDDYEKIPIEAFGLAMLRGMGWKPDEGIGKTAQIVSAAIPEMRPKGMGLGADKVTLQKQSLNSKTKGGEQLKIEKGSFVKIIAGKFANNYGQIEGFDDEAGRMIVKMALSGESQSLNECLIRPVTKSEYTENSKILNMTKYEEFKRKGKIEDREENAENKDSSEEETKSRRDDHERNSKISKKAKKRSKYSSDESSDSERRSRKRKDSSDSDNDYRHKKSKKSKKSHKRDSSSERSRKKNKRRDRESDRTRERRRENSSDRKKHKRHKRSRSRSPNRR